MVTNGRVIAGHFLNAQVTTAFIGSVLVVQSGLKWRKLDVEQVAEWEDVTSESNSGTISAVGQAVAGAVLPRFVSKAASAAVGATIDSKVRPPRTVRVDWTDGKRSLIKMPEKLFTHMETLLSDRRVTRQATPAVDAEPTTPSTVTEQAFSLVSGLIKDRLPTPSSESATQSHPDLTEQLAKLGSLRDSGVLTEEEFEAKKSELLSSW